MFKEAFVYLWDLISDPVYVLFSNILSLFATLFSFWMYFYDFKRKVLSHASSTYQIIRNSKTSLNDIEVTYKGEKVNALAVTNFVIWNSGNKLIEGSDIASAAPLCIQAIDGSKILSVKITDVVEPSNKFTISDCFVSDNMIHIAFDYVDSNEGAVIQVLHTGDADSLVSDCIIKGGKYLPREENPYYQRMKRYKKGYVLYPLVPLLIIGIIFRGNSHILALSYVMYISVVMAYVFAELIFEFIHLTVVPSKLRTYSKH